MKKLHRRDVLKGLAAGAGAAALAPAATGTAQAQSGGKVVVGTWGGDYAALLTKNIEVPLLKPKGIEVLQDQASDAPRRAGPRWWPSAACRAARSTSRASRPRTCTR